MIPNRRKFLTWAAAAPFAAMAAGRALAEAPACFNPDSLPMAQRGLRRSLGFVVNSADPKKRCDLCAFYKGGTAGCGTCQLLSGGPGAAGSVCASFAAKAH